MKLLKMYLRISAVVVVVVVVAAAELVVAVAVSFDMLLHSEQQLSP